MNHPHPLTGTLLDGRYRLTELIGTGGFGLVFKGVELVAGEPVAACAVKLFPLDDEHEGQAVLKEIRDMARFSHPHLIGYRSAGHMTGGLYLSMELASSTLRQRMEDSGPLQPEEMLSITRGLASVLEYLHAAGAVHGDVKPANLLQVGGLWKLADLGLLRTVDSTMERASRTRGTLHYLAPETVQGWVGPTVDMWALGVLVQECLTGQRPYHGETADQVIHQLLQLPPRIASDLPVPFDMVVRGCLLQDPRSRWTATRVLETLQSTPLEASAPAPRATTLDPDAPTAWFSPTATLPLGSIDLATLADMHRRSYLILHGQARGSMEQARALNNWLESYRGSVDGLLAEHPGCPQAQPCSEISWWQIRDDRYRFVGCCNSIGYLIPHSATPVPRVTDFDPS